MPSRFPVVEFPSSKNCRPSDCRRLFAGDSSVSFGALPKAFRFADRSTANSNRRSSSAWADSPRPRRFWRADARHSHVYSRIERHSRKSESLDGANGARGPARVQGMRAIFSKSAHRSHRHADSNRAETFGSTGGAAKTRTARGPADAAGDGRKPGRERDQSGDDQIAAVLAQRCRSR